MAYTAIDDPEAYFQVKIWTGTGSSLANTLDGDTDMAPDYVMIKQRSGTQQWNGYDDLRGVQKYLGWNTAIVENTQAQGLTAFGSDGFTVGTDDMVNKSSSTYLAYCWKETADAGFDMVLYTGNATDDVDISHSLSAVPHLIIVKNRDNSNNESWAVYHHKNTSAPETDFLKIDTTAATGDSDEIWSDEPPTSSVFTIGRQDMVNTSGGNHIAYLWSEKQGFSKFGSYTANNDADGAFIYLGFRPALFICKKYSGTESWYANDSKRSTYNPTKAEIYLDGNSAEDTASTRIDLLSNGVKMRTDNGGYNYGSETYVYMAWAEAPFVNSNGVPNNAR